MLSFDDEVSVSKSDKFKSKVQFPKASERHRKSPYPMIPATVATEIVLRDTNTLRHQFVAIKDSFGYILYEDVIAEEPYPPFPASIKDGYAVLTDDTTEIRKVVGSVTPGGHLDFHLQPGQCIRVSTGSAIPDQSDAVIQVEDTTVIEDDDEGNEVCIKILKQVEKRYQDIRPVGSDILKGEVLIPKYHKVSAAEIGVMVTCGIETISVFKKPAVSLLSTGDELLEPGTPLTPGYIRDCNRTSLEFMLYENRISMFDAGIARDTPDDIKCKLMSAFEMSDVVITTGSVSMGEKDILKQVLETDFGATIQFARIKMKPGKPTTFSTAYVDGKKKYVFSLPGNPVSAFVCFYLFVIPCIKKLMGFNEPMHKTIKVQLAHDIKLDERPEYHRACLVCNEEGVFVASSTGPQQSSRLLSLQNAHALLLLPPRTSSCTVLEAGSKVEAILLKPI